MRAGTAGIVVVLGLVGGLGVGAAWGEWDQGHVSSSPVAAGSPEPSADATVRSPGSASRSATRPSPGTSPSPQVDPVEPQESSTIDPTTDLTASPTADPTQPVTPQPEVGSGLLGAEATSPPTGVFVVAAGEAPAPGAGTVRTVRIEVEQGLPVDAQVFADAVMATLNDPRGWSALDGVTFARTTASDAAIRVVLASPETTDQLCAPLRTNGTYSCGVTGTAVLNFTRWVSGATDFDGDMVGYRQYVVNHEVGHVLGHHHENCPAPGALAPVMVQQTISAQGCVVNGWPNPGASTPS